MASTYNPDSTNATGSSPALTLPDDGDDATAASSDIPDKKLADWIQRQIEMNECSNWTPFLDVVGFGGGTNRLDGITCFYISPTNSFIIIGGQQGGVAAAYLFLLTAASEAAFSLSGASADKLRGIDSDGTTVVMVGDAAGIWTTPHATPGTATARTAPVSFGTDNIVDVKWFAGGSVFIAITSTGLVATSPDGVTWTARTAANAFPWTHIAVSETVAVVGSTQSSKHPFMFSADGITWTANTDTTNTLTKSPYPVWSSKFSKFFCMTKVGTDLKVVTSPDGQTWTEIAATIVASAGANPGFLVATANQVFSASGVFRLRTVDGTNWVAMPMVLTSNALEFTPFVSTDNRVYAAVFLGYSLSGTSVFVAASPAIR